MTNKRNNPKPLLWLGILLLTFLPAAAHAAPADPDSAVYGTYIRNDMPIYYCRHRGVTVTLDVTKGLDTPEISIVNEGEDEFLFDPLQIVVSNYMVKGAERIVRYKIGRFPFGKQDLAGLARDTLQIYPYNAYTRQVGRSSFWGDMLGGIVTDMAYSGNDNGDRVVRYLEDRRRRDENAAEIKRIDEGYWRSNTIFPHTSHKGFVAIKRFRGDNLVIDIPVNGFVCHFEVLPKKYM